MKEKVLLIGGAGYIGTSLAPLLLNEGYKVTVLDMFLFNQTPMLDLCLNPDFEVIRGDFREEEILSKALTGMDYIVPLAAIVGYPHCDADRTAAKTTNVGAIQTLLSLRKPEQKIIYPCTNSGYGIGEQNDFCTEDSPLRPISLYGKTKVEAERLVLEAGNSLSFRYATVFGASPRIRLDLLVNNFIFRAVMDKTVTIFEGHFRRNYIHVKDAAGAVLHAMKNFDAMKGLPYNCGLSTANLTKIQLCEKIKQHIPDFVYIEAPVGEDPDKRDYNVSNARLEATGWVPQVSLDDGIKELIKAFKIIQFYEASMR
ncbi:MAG: NAD-dependent epimerase/dehydratase [Defluviitaleaceae bacterium]|nr:NAD-dependent epimerase/dehydratase [Defluviitaleaceae bacterium]MCL2238345.1 NAD-dependent epimerase/dehydratase [Defluviitaleaceae bacterium]